MNETVSRLVLLSQPNPIPLARFALGFKDCSLRNLFDDDAADIGRESDVCLVGDYSDSECIFLCIEAWDEEEEGKEDERSFQTAFPVFLLQPFCPVFSESIIREGQNSVNDPMDKFILLIQLIRLFC